LVDSTVHYWMYERPNLFDGDEHDDCIAAAANIVRHKASPQGQQTFAYRARSPVSGIKAKKVGATLQARGQLF
jgi:hypothetical protein